MKWKWSLITIILFSFSLFHPCAQADDSLIIVQKGDTLYNIAQKYSIPVTLLMKYNNITDATKVKEGSKIEIPEIHSVKKGETLYSIAKKYSEELSESVRR